MRTALLLGTLACTAAAAQDAPRVSTARGPPVRPYEVVLSPVVLQVNGKFVQHAGTFGGVLWHGRPDVALQLWGGWNWYAQETGFSDELSKVRMEPQNASSLLWTWGLLAGVEVMPLRGELRLFGAAPLAVSLGLSGAVGVGGTKHRLRPEQALPDGTHLAATYFDAGNRFMYASALSVRLHWAERVSLRVELRDVIFSSQVDSAYGCTARPISTEQRFGCRPPPEMTREDQELLMQQLRNPSWDIMNTISVAVGVSWAY